MLRHTCSIRSRRARRRRGFTLIELLVTMMAGISMLLLGISVIQQAMKLSELNTDRGQYQQTLSLLGDSLRRDVHSAQSASVSESENDTQVLSLKLTDETQVDFVFQAGWVEHRLTKPGSDKPAGHQRFRLSSDHRFELVSRDRLVEVYVWRQSEDQRRLESHIGAVINRADLVKRSSLP